MASWARKAERTVWHPGQGGWHESCLSGAENFNPGTRHFPVIPLGKNQGNQLPGLAYFPPPISCPCPICPTQPLATGQGQLHRTQSQVGRTEHTYRTRLGAAQGPAHNLPTPQYEVKSTPLFPEVNLLGEGSQNH